MKDFETVVGLEIHLELDTKTKMFCQCRNEDIKEPNKNVCHICLGYPGVLPSPNKKAIFYTIKLGLAMSCQIPEESKFDRKHYFYPDLPKNYQISQYDMPFATNGSLKIKNQKSKIKNIRITRVHLEEDAGKLIHPEGANYSLVDFNRSGIPLLEIVTEPDIDSPQLAKKFLQEIQLIARNLGVSRADMEKGHLRCDANISVRKGNASTPVFEIKNMNSFRSVERALSYEENRLREDFDKLKNQKGKRTMSWLETQGKTQEMRTKEEASDYRYFPEPDIPPFCLHKMFDLKALKTALPKMPNQQRQDLKEELNLADKEVEVLISNKSFYEYFSKIADSKNARKIADWMINENLGTKINPADLLELIKVIEEGKVTRAYAKQKIIPELLGGKKIKQVLSTIPTKKIDFDQAIKDAISENQDAVKNYQNGKESALQFLVGQVMQKTQGQANPQDILQEIKEMLK